ncbi:hypothetical protein GCK72_007474 [Caenorhabditis remanei]|uniref:BTB domain-containing protein n=1 Tax=Caenorhabditis remanei TaxID=31234 RepID=A0A6A5HJ53_CAERE|nr:hypothetical protein GCK72_007474 [Caenorhabditis remanei]KAF1767515.1 hypothetical protein GCK72_007474 [Caenorhabditis remanei]
MESGCYNEFVLTHVFENVSNFKESESNFSKVEEHFNIPWKLNAARKKTNLALYLRCDKLCTDGNWSIDTEFEFKLMSVNGRVITRNKIHTFRSSSEKKIADGHGWGDFVEWNLMETNYAVDDKIFVVACVKIKKSTGINKTQLRIFDETVSEFSDVVLTVEDKKFYVLKLFLASQSTYFKSLFLGNFEESKKSEISLADVNSDDFQNFLEIVHGEDALNDDTVDGILNLADMYDAPSVHKKCEQFMIEKSEKSLKIKLQMSTRYKMKKLQNFCLVKIKTKEDIRSVLPGDLSKLDPSVSSHLMHMLASLE